MKSKEETQETSAGKQRPFLGVKFDCCGVYTRIYRKPDVLEYSGRCPKCLKAISVRVDQQNGVPTKFLRAW